MTGAVRRVRAALPSAPVMLLPPAAAAGMVLWGLDRPSAYGNELDTLWAARLSWPQLRHLLSHVDLVHGTYYAFMHLWLTMGSSLLWIRVPSAVAAVLATACVTALGTRLGGRRLGLLAGSAYLLLPFVDTYAQNARSYSIASLLVGLTVLALLRALDQPHRWARWLTYGALVAVNGWLHEMSTLAVPALGVSLLLARTPAPVLRRWLLASVLAAVAVAPLAWLSVGQDRAVGYLRAPGLGSVRALVALYFGGPVLQYAVLGVVAFGIAVTTSRGHRGPTVTRIAVPLVLLPPAVLMTVSQHHPLYSSRYVLYGTIGSALLMAQGADRVARAVARHRGGLVTGGVAAALVAALALAVWPQQRYARTVESRHQDYTGVAHYLAARGRRGDAVVYDPAVYRLLSLGYPRAVHRLADPQRDQSPARAGTFVGTFRPARAEARALVGYRRVWVVGTTGLRPSRVSLPQPVARTLRTRFRPAGVRHYPGIAVTLLVRCGHTCRSHVRER